MARKVFYSFHYRPDCSRAAQVRNIGVVEGNTPARDNDWETITHGGAAAIEQWIADQLYGRSCTVVLIGTNTAGRKWIDYEITKTWNDGKGLVGIYIHNLKDLSGVQASKGANPFGTFTFGPNKTLLSSVVKTYNPLGLDSKAVYKYISDNLENWIEEAIEIRSRY